MKSKLHSSLLSKINKKSYKINKTINHLIIVDITAKITHILITLSLFYSCQNDLMLKKQENTDTLFYEAQKKTSMFSKKIKQLSILQDLHNILIKQGSSCRNSKDFRNKLPVFKIEQMPSPFLHPNGNSDIDLYFKNIFFRILEMQETLRDLIEYYNKFTIKTNLNFLSHPAQIHNSTEIKNLIKLRNVVSEEIDFVKNEISNYNSRINTYFPNVSINHKKAGYYSYDNSHFLYNQFEFSIEDIDNFSYCFHQKIVNEDLLKLTNPKLKLKKPEVGSRRGTVFVNAGKPNIIRGTLGNDLEGMLWELLSA